MNTAARDMLLIFISASALMILCWMITGPSLGLFLGGMTLGALIAAPAALLRDRWMMRPVVIAGVIDGISAVWLVACVAGHLSLLQWVQCYLLLIAWTLSVCGVAWLAWALRVNAIAASAIATLLALAWLSAPIWASAHLSAGAMQTLAAAHPLITINGVVSHLGIWTEQASMYSLTNLGQDVPYRFNSAWLVAGGYAVVATVLIALSALLGWHPGWSAPSDPPTRSTPPTATAR